MFPPEIQIILSNFFIKYGWIILIVFCCVASGYLSVYFLGKNNPIELEVEKIIEEETGIHLDLTP